MDQGTITCLKCGHEFEISNALTHQIREHLKMELQADIVEREADATRKLGDVKAREDALAREKETLDAEVEEQLTQKLAEAEAKAAKKAQGRVTLESGLRHALERNEFHLHYQPKRDIHSGQVAGHGSIAALAASRTGRGGADALHPGRRRKRFDGADRQVGADDRVSAKRGLAERGPAPCEHRRQSDGAQ